MTALGELAINGWFVVSKIWFNMEVFPWLDGYILPLQRSDYD
jgi:hypothetical protein